MSIDDQVAEIMSGVRAMLERKAARGVQDPEHGWLDEAATRKLAKLGHEQCEEAVAEWDAQDGRKDFPYFLPDGSDVTTVDQVAAMMGLSKGAAACYVLEQKGLPKAMRREAKALLPAPSSHTDGVAVMLYPSRNDAQQISYHEGGNDWSQLHITVLYFGGLEEAPSEDALKQLTQRLSLSMLPLRVTMNGITRFTAEEDSQYARDPLVVNCDSPDLERLRKKALQLCGEMNLKPILNHGYSPHMTLGFLEQDQPNPIDRWVKRDIIVRDIALGYGDSYTHYMMGTGNEITDLVSSKDVFTGAVAPLQVSGISNGIARRASRIKRRKRRRRNRPDDSQQ